MRFLQAAGLVAALLVHLSATAFAESNTIEARVTKFGEVLLTHVDKKPATLHESRKAMAYAEGYSRVMIDPLNTFLVLALRSAREGALNVEALDQLFANMPSQYAQSLSGAIPQSFKRINLELGTLESSQFLPLSVRIGWDSMRWWRVPEEAQVALERVAPVDREVMAAWLAGAQAAAAENAATFYEKHPLFAPTRLVEHFLQATVLDIVQSDMVHARLYDLAAINGTAAQLRALGWFNWGEPDAGLSVLSAGIDGRADGDENLRNAVNLPQIPYGASNGWGFTFRPADNPSELSYVAGGEPHQPDGAQEQIKTVLGYLMDVNGATIPYASIGLASMLGGPGLSFSRNSGSGATAGPSAGSLLLFARTNYARDAYLDPDGVWRPFTMRTVQLSSGPVQVRQIASGEEYGGDVAFFARDPATGTRYAIAMRAKDSLGFRAALMKRSRAQLYGDTDLFQQAMDTGLNHWGESGVFTDALNQSRSYVALHMGQSDQVVDENAINRFALNALSHLTRKIGQYNTPWCFTDGWAAANNGSLRGGNCITPNAMLDQGYPTPRQALVQDFYESHGLATTPISRDEVYRFATSSESYSHARLSEVLVVSLFNYAASAVGSVGSAEQINLAAAVAGALIGRVAISDNSPFPVLLLHITEAITPLLYSPTSPLNQITREYLTLPHVPLSEMVAGIDQQSAHTMIAAMVGAIDYILTQCLPQGKLLWNQIAETNHRGQIVGSTAGAGVGEGLSIANYRIEPGCRIRAQTSSPFKFAFVGQAGGAGKLCYLPHGGTVSPETLLTGLYESSFSSWLEQWRKLNPEGLGYDSHGAYRCVMLKSGDPSFGIPDSDLKLTFKVQVPAGL